MAEEYISPEQVASVVPIERGDIVLVASDVTYLCYLGYRAGHTFSLDELIDRLQEKVGKEGTLLFPTYNWGFCRGRGFDYRNSKSEVGSLSQAALERADFKRTRHAIYSFAVWGKDTDRLLAMQDANSFVGDTPFDYLYKMNAKMVILNATDCYTFMHYVEESIGVDYRFCKAFYGTYIDENGVPSERMYSMYVRYLDGREVELHPDMDRWCLEIGAFENVENPYMPIWVSRFQPTYTRMKEDILHNHSRHMVLFTGDAWHEHDGK